MTVTEQLDEYRTAAERKTSLFGWCQSHGKPDAQHAQCRGTFVRNGITYRCGCPNHRRPRPKGDDE